MVSPMFLALAIAPADVLTCAFTAALGVLVIAAIAERLHAARVARVARLAFGPTGRPSVWAHAAPFARCAGLALCVWGAVVLGLREPTGGEVTPEPHASRHLLIALDVSPSMLINDAGPDSPKVSRSIWAGKIVQGILDRLDMSTTRISVVAFYTKALPVLEDTTDRNVVSNLFDGLRLYVAFEGGSTDLSAGVDEALKIARPWAHGSATLVVVSDGDAQTNLGSIRLPPAIADSIVIGVGDPYRASLVSGHSSKQETLALRQLTARLDGYYHEGNTKHLPSRVLDRLRMTIPNTHLGLSVRELALLLLGVGAALVGLVGPALLLAGVRRDVARAERARPRRGGECGVRRHPDRPPKRPANEQ